MDVIKCKGFTISRFTSLIPKPHLHLGEEPGNEATISFIASFSGSTKAGHGNEATVHTHFNTGETLGDCQLKHTSTFVS